MVNLVRTNKASWVALLILCALLFFCKGASVNSILHSQMDHNSQNMEMSSCCGESAAVSMYHGIDIAVLNSGNIALAMALVVVLLGLIKVLESHALSIRSYVQAIRRALGSFLGFNYILQLFRIGILHPKIW
jgi:hypothetical protein